MFEKEKISSENSKKFHEQEPPQGDTSKHEKVESGQASENGLLAGKFKSVEDLSKAYIELEKKFGFQAQELGDLRKIAEEYAIHKENCRINEQRLNEFQELVRGMTEKYDSDNYLRNKEFRDILSAAYQGFGNKLDVDEMVDLLEKYHNSRLSMAKQADMLKSEADSATDMLAYSNTPSKVQAPKKRLSDMTPEELNKALDELM